MEHLFAQLKKDTLHQHQTLENSVPFATFHHNAPVPVPSYRAILSTMYHFHLKVSEVTQDCVAHLYQQGSVSAAPMASLVALLNSDNVLLAVQKDIDLLDQAVSDAPSSSINPPAPISLSIAHVPSVAVPEFNGLSSSCFAGMYVWLGSSMGANLISRRLHKQASTTQVPSGLPTYYYDIMAATAKNWVNFKQRTPSIASGIMNGLPSDSTAMTHEIVADANLWFGYLIALGREAV